MGLLHTYNSHTSYIHRLKFFYQPLLTPLPPSISLDTIRDSNSIIRKYTPPHPLIFCLNKHILNLKFRPNPKIAFDRFLRYFRDIFVNLYPLFFLNCKLNIWCAQTDEVDQQTNIQMDREINS